MQTGRERFLGYVREKALPELKAGNAIYGNILQRVFLHFPEEKGLQVEIAAAYETLLAQISAKKLIRLSEEYRVYYDGYFVVDDAADWWYTKPGRMDYPHLTENQFAAVLKFGTFSEDGFDRQWCMEALDGMEGSLPFFFLRLNDWVGQIRESAFLLSKKRLAQCGAHEFFFALPMLEKVAASGRREDGHVAWLAGQVKERSRTIFKEMPDALCAGRIPYYGVNVKNAIYRLLAKHKLLPLAQMERLLAAEWTGYGKKLLLDGIFLHYGYEKERVKRYLASRNTLVRHRALWFRYAQEQKAWQGMEGMLLDRARRVRRDVGYILRKHTDFRILDYYMEELRREASDVVLLGIGENGTGKDAAAIEPYLASENGRMVRAALVAYGRLAAEKGDSVYWKFLFDERPAIAKTAYQLILKNRIHYGAGEIYRLFCAHRQEAAGKYLLRLLLCEPSWERLPYLLELYAAGGLSQEEEWRVAAGIRNLYVYATVSKGQAEKILQALGRAGEKLPGEWKKDILFDLEHVMKRGRPDAAIF